MTYKIVHGLVLSSKELGGRLIAVISDGSVQHGDEGVTVLDCEWFLPGEEDKARAWYERMKIEQPWNKRN